MSKLPKLSPLVRGLLLLVVYGAAALALETFSGASGLVVIILAAIFTCFWIPGLLAEVAGRKPSEQLWFAFGTLGAFLGALAVTIGLVRLLVIFPAGALHTWRFAICFAVVLSLSNAGTLVLLTKLLVLNGNSLSEWISRDSAPSTE